MEPAEIGAKLKQMYPQYAGIDDAILGQKYLLKYGDKGLQSLGLSTTDVNKDATALRKEYDGLVETKSYKELKKQYDNMQSSGETGAGDIGIMYSYIKMLDPTTAVREGELALGDAAAGLPDRVVKAYNRAVKTKGAGLAPEQRKQYLAEGAKIYNNAALQQKEVAARYSGYASDMGVDPKNVVGNLESIKVADVPEIKKSTEPTGLFSGIRGLYGQMQSELDSGNVKELQLKTLLPILNIYDPRKAIEEQNLGAGYNPTGGKAAMEVLSTLGIRDLVKNSGSKIKETAGKILNPRKTLGEAQNVYAEGKGGVNTKAIYEAGKKYVESDPRAAKLLETFKPVISKTKDASTLIDRLGVWKDAYNKASQAKQGATAGLLDKLYKAGRAELTKVAPEASKMRDLSALTYEVPRKINTGITSAIKATGLGRLLGL
jgi:hypothetical protein